MHRKPKLLDAARHLQQVVEASGGNLSYTQTLDVLMQLEGFEGYRQVRAMLGDEALKGASKQSRKGRRNEFQQSLAMFIHGHGGYVDGRKLHLPQHMTLAMRTANVEYMAWMAVPPCANMLLVEDSEALMIASDWDAGERYEAALSDGDVLLRYSDAFGEHKFTWKDVRESEHIEGHIWRISGREYELLSLVPAGTPRECQTYVEKPGEFLTRAQFAELHQELLTLESDTAPGSSARIAELQDMLANSDWKWDEASGAVVSRWVSQYEFDEDLPF